MGVLSRQLFVLVLMRGGVMPQISGPFRVAFCLLEFISRRSDLKPLANLITWCNLIWTASEAGARRLQVLPILERVRRFFFPPPFVEAACPGFSDLFFPFISGVPLGLLDQLVGIPSIAMKGLALHTQLSNHLWKGGTHKSCLQMLVFAEFLQASPKNLGGKEFGHCSLASVFPVWMRSLYGP